MNVMIDTDEVYLPGNYDVLYAALDSLVPYQTVVVLSLSDETKQYFIKNGDYEFVSLGEEDQRKLNKTQLTDYIRRYNSKVTNVDFAPISDYYKRATGNLAELLDYMAKAVGQVEIIPSNTKQPITYEKLCCNGRIIRVGEGKFTCVRGSLMSCLSAYWVSEHSYTISGSDMAKYINECPTVVIVEKE